MIQFSEILKKQEEERKSESENKSENESESESKSGSESESGSELSSRSKIPNPSDKPIEVSEVTIAPTLDSLETSKNEDNNLESTNNACCVCLENEKSW